MLVLKTDWRLFVQIRYQRPQTVGTIPIDVYNSGVGHILYMFLPL